jgi:hypothetical protein
VGKIKVKRTRVRVRDVRPGAESDLRPLLDSAVLQPNIDVTTAPASGSLACRSAARRFRLSPAA